MCVVAGWEGARVSQSSARRAAPARRPGPFSPPSRQPQPAPLGTFRHREGAGTRSARCGGGWEGRGASRGRLGAGPGERGERRCRAGQGRAGPGRAGRTRGAVGGAPCEGPGPLPSGRGRSWCCCLYCRCCATGVDPRVSSGASSCRALWRRARPGGAKPPGAPQVCGTTAASLHLLGRGPRQEGSWGTGVGSEVGARGPGVGWRLLGWQQDVAGRGSGVVMPKAWGGVSRAPFLLLASGRDPGSPSPVGRSRGKFRLWDVQAAGRIDPLPWDPPTSLSRKSRATAVLWSWTLGRLELLVGTSWGSGSPLHAAPPEPEVVSTTG